MSLFTAGHTLSSFRALRPWKLICLTAAKCPEVAEYQEIVDTPGGCGRPWGGGLPCLSGALMFDRRLKNQPRSSGRPGIRSGVA